MIAWLEGNLREKAPTRIVLDVRGVGYELLVPLSTFEGLPDLGKTVSLLVHTAVREDAIQLFGFATSLEKELFHLLLKANRVGPKLAQSILSGMEPHRLLRLLRDADVKGLRKAPGVGPKMAERIAVELREAAEALAGRVGADGASGSPTLFDRVEPDEELMSALINLGYSRSQAERVVESALAEAEPGAALEDLIRLALRHLAP
ncbi:MAG: Holliday junction branch migration protein RuvA [bacterium]|nr:Holliday junction branch migration protein RuvA [Deltaproteobacteria bacterium]MCP4905451.1 Holliday junction branch migration protein RuvA [bacterium]